MKIKYMRYSLMTLLFMVAYLTSTTMTAQASFVIDENQGGEKLYIIKADNTNSFNGFVGESSIIPDVDVITNGKVDAWNDIKPANNELLTDLIFTPTGDKKYGGFSFRGQLEKTGFNGEVYVKVIDQLGNDFNFEFIIDKANQDFDRIGIVSTEDEWIKSVEIWTTGTGSFKAIKQMDFSSQTTTVPEPAIFWLFGTGLVGLGGLMRMFRK